MFKLKCRMFEESKKSTASENIIITLLRFFFMFVLIQLAESIIPSIMSYDELQLKIAAEGTADIKRSMEIATEIMMQEKYLIPTLFCTFFGYFCHQASPVSSSSSFSRLFVSSSFS